MYHAHILISACCFPVLPQCAAYPGKDMLFMDFRRHHTGVWEHAAQLITPGAHPNAGDGVWGTEGEPPSFLYAMPLGGNRVFLEVGLCLFTLFACTSVCGTAGSCTLACCRLAVLRSSAELRWAAALVPLSSRDCMRVLAAVGV